MSKFQATFVLKGEDEFSGVVDKAKSKMSMLEQVVGSGAVSAALKVAGLAGGWSSVYAKMLEASYEAKRFTVQSDRLGIPIEQLAKLSRYAEQSGINLSTMGRGMLMLQKWSNDALSDANSQSAKLASTLGLSGEQLKEIRHGGVAAFAEIKEQLDKTVPEAEQVAIWTSLIGARAYELSNFLKMTPEEIREAGGEARTMSKETIEQLVKGQKQYANLQQDISILAADMAVAFGPVLALVGFLLRYVIALVYTLNTIPIAVKYIQMAFYKLAGWYFSNMPRFLGGNKDKGEEFKRQADAYYWEAQGKTKDMMDAMKYNFKTGASYLGIGGDEKKKKKEIEDKSDLRDLRTVSERVKYEDELKRQKSEQAKIAKEEAKTDTQKARALELELEQLEGQLIVLRATKGEYYKLTIEYLNYMKAVKKARAELAELEEKIIKKQSTQLFAGIDEQKRYVLEMMKLSKQFTDTELQNFEAANEYEKYQRLVNESRRAQANALLYGEQNPEFWTASFDAMMNARKQENKIIETLAARAMAGKDFSGAAAKGDALQRIAGGGPVGVSANDVPQRSLKNLEAIRALLQRLVEQGGQLDRNNITQIIKDIT